MGGKVKDDAVRAQRGGLRRVARGRQPAGVVAVEMHARRVLAGFRGDGEEARRGTRTRAGDRHFVQLHVIASARHLAARRAVHRHLRERCLVSRPERVEVVRLGVVGTDLLHVHAGTAVKARDRLAGGVDKLRHEAHEARAVERGLHDDGRIGRRLALFHLPVVARALPADGRAVAVWGERESHGLVRTVCERVFVGHAHEVRFGLCCPVLIADDQRREHRRCKCCKQKFILHGSFPLYDFSRPLV